MVDFEFVWVRVVYFEFVLVHDVEDIGFSRDIDEFLCIYVAIAMYFFFLRTG